MLRKMGSVMTAVLVAASMMAGCGSSNQKAETAAATTAAQTEASKESEQETTGGDITIGFAVSTLSNDFFVSMKEAGDAAAQKMGIKLVTLDAQDSTETQATQIEDLITQGVDLLIINPVDSDAVGTSVVAANEAKIPVITVTRPSNSGTVAQHLDIDMPFVFRFPGRYGPRNPDFSTDDPLSIQL